MFHASLLTISIAWAPLSLGHVGNVHTGTTTKGHMSNQMFTSRYQLLHQVDRGKTTMRNDSQRGGEVHLKTPHIQVWFPVHHCQWQRHSIQSSDLWRLPNKARCQAPRNLCWTSPNQWSGRGSQQYTLGLSLFALDNDQWNSFPTHICHRPHDPRWSRGTIDNETIVPETTKWREHEGKTWDNGRSPWDGHNQRRGCQALSIKKIQYKGSTTSLSTRWPCMASMRWFKKDPWATAWTQLGRPIQGHIKPRHESYML